MSHKIPYKYLPYWRKHGHVNNWSIFVWLYRLYLRKTEGNETRKYRAR